MPTPRVSILLPVYDGERYLAQALDSILHQSFTDWELVAIDDGSTDRTAQILESYADPRVHVFRQEHAGLIGALKHAHRRATASYLARMDADDVSYPDRLTRQVELLDQARQFDLVTCHARLLDHEGRDVGTFVTDLSDDLELDLAAGNPMVHGSVMMRREAFESAGGYSDPPEDYALWIHMLAQGRQFHVLDEVLYGFRTHSDRYSLTHASSQSAALVHWQLPLLERCTATRNQHRPEVRAKLVRGWGHLGSAAYRSGQQELGRQAYRQFRQLIRGARTGPVEAAALHAAEALVWGGCPLGQRLALRLLELRWRPHRISSYQKLLLSLPFAPTLYERCQRS